MLAAQDMGPSILDDDNVALGRLPTSVTTDPSVRPLRELAYLPAGEMSPHGVDPDRPRAGKLPAQVLETLEPPKPSGASDEGQSAEATVEADG